MRAKEERLRGCGGLDGPGYTTHAGHGLEDSHHARQSRMGMPVAVARILVLGLAPLGRLSERPDRQAGTPAVCLC
jgi:hypothetical protein